MFELVLHLWDKNDIFIESETTMSSFVSQGSYTEYIFESGKTGLLTSFKVLCIDTHTPIMVILEYEIKE